MTTRGPLPDVWYTRDFPVLVEIARVVDQGGEVSREDLQRALDMDEPTVDAALRALLGRRLIGGIGAAEKELLYVTEISPDAFVLTGLHPSGDDALESLVDAFRLAARTASNADDRSRLQRLVDSLLSVPRDVAVGVLTAYLSQQLSR